MVKENYWKRYLRLEKNYWWFIARRNIILNLVEDSILDRTDKILEIGCSGGQMIRFLNQNGYNNVYGIDTSRNAIKECKMKGLKNVSVMDGTKPKFPDGEFDLIIASDVLEHMENNIHVLMEWNRILKSYGEMIIFVPAFNFLWSKHDETNNHYRRYSRKVLNRKLELTGFKIHRSSYWNFMLFFPIAIIRILQRIFKSKAEHQLYEMNPLINKLFTYLMAVENKILTKLNFPVGISVFAHCKRVTHA